MGGERAYKGVTLLVNEHAKDSVVEWREAPSRLMWAKVRRRDVGVCVCVFECIWSSKGKE